MKKIFVNIFDTRDDKCASKVNGLELKMSLSINLSMNTWSSFESWFWSSLTILFCMGYALILILAMFIDTEASL